MRASIIIVSYNGSMYLKSCIDSVTDEISLEDEIILVDNASTDGSVSIVKQNWPEVKIFHNDVNLGFAAACNQGADYARGDTLIFLNQDTRVVTGWLAGLLKPLDQDPVVGLVTSKLLLMSHPDQIHTCGFDIHFTGFSFSRGYLCPSARYHLPEMVGSVSGASFAIPRHLWERLGGFDQGFFMYYEETDLCWRARLAGFSSLYSPASIVYHDYPLHSSALAHSYTERNRLVLLLKNWKGLTLFLLLPSLLLAEIIDWGYMLLVGRVGVRAKLSAWFWLMRNISKVNHSRRSVQLARKTPDWVLLKSCTPHLTPRMRTGGKIGEVVVDLCNLWFNLHYQYVYSLLHNFDI